MATANTDTVTRLTNLGFKVGEYSREAYNVSGSIDVITGEQIKLRRIYNITTPEGKTLKLNATKHSSETYSELDQYLNTYEEAQKNKIDESVKEKIEAEKTNNKFVGSVLANILDKYDNPTYNLKLYMIPPDGNSDKSNIRNPDRPEANPDDTSGEEARNNSGKVGDYQSTGKGYLNDCVRAEPEDTVVLAQTGVTEVGIDNLEILVVPGPEETSEISTVNFTITQPNAADFPDQIVKAKTYLGAPPDAPDVPLFLEINFVGYKESDLNTEKWDVDKGGSPVTIAGPFVLPLIMKNFSMNISQAGSRYDFECVNKDDVSGTDNYFRLLKNYTITGSTIHEMLQDLETQINAYYRKTDGESANENSQGTNTEATRTSPYEISFGLSKLKKANVLGLGIKDQRLDINRAETVAKAIKTKGISEIESPTVAEDNESQRKEKEAKTDEFYNKFNLPKPENNNATRGPFQSALDGNTNFLDAISKPKKAKADDTEKNPEVNPVTIDLKQGMTIKEVVGILLSMNNEFMQNATRTKDINDPTKEEVDATKEIMWYQVEGYIKYGTYNEKKKEYNKMAVFVPRTYKTSSRNYAIFPWEVEKNNNLSKEEATTNLRLMNIRKAYEYIFTGRNDQIKNLDITYKEGLALLLPPERGTLGDISLNAENILKSAPKPTNESLEDAGLETLKKESGGKGFFSSLKDLLSKGEEIISNIGRAANLLDSEIKDLVTNANGKAAEKLRNALSNSQTAQAIADNLTAQRKATAQSGSSTETDISSPVSSGFVYGGDLIGDNVYTERLGEMSKKTKGSASGFLLNPDKVEDVKEKFPNLGAQRANFQTKDGFANVGTYNGIKNNLFTYLYHQHQAVDFMMQLEMTVRGDPYWLGRMPLEPGQNQLISGQDADKSDDKDDKEYTASLKNENYLVFSLNSPRLFDPDVDNEDNNTGLWLKEGDGTSYFISGVYQLKTVLHRFNGGVYDCDINCVKEMAIDLRNTDRITGNFEKEDVLRQSRTSKTQDGTLTESEALATDPRSRSNIARVNGFIDARGADATGNKGSTRLEKADALLAKGDITKEEYDAWKANYDAKQASDNRRSRTERTKNEDLGVSDYKNLPYGTWYENGKTYPIKADGSVDYDNPIGGTGG